MSPSRKARIGISNDKNLSNKNKHTLPFARPKGNRKTAAVNIAVFQTAPFLLQYYPNQSIKTSIKCQTSS